MGTEILKSFGTLQSELEQAKDSLKGVDENIRRLIGRDPSDVPARANLKRGTSNDDRSRQRPGRNRSLNHENDEPATKRRTGLSVFQRLDRQNPYEEDLHPQVQKQIISKVIVTPKELPSRQEALDAQSKDERFNARNRRMFGALLGTLQKFQQEETKLKQKEEKRAQVEKKIEEHEIKEKEEIQKERQELFFNRKKKQAEIRMIELKMMRMKEYAAWEERQKPRMCFIQTKAKPHIHFLPRKMNDAARGLLDTCRGDIEKMIDKKRQEVYDELQHIEERMKKNFGSKSKSKENNEDECNTEPINDKPSEEEHEETTDTAQVHAQEKNEEEEEARTQENSEQTTEKLSETTITIPSGPPAEENGQINMEESPEEVTHL